MNDEYAKIKQYIEGKRQFTIPDIQRDVSVSYSVARKFVEEMVSKNKLKYLGGLLYEETKADVRREYSFAAYMEEKRRQARVVKREEHADTEVGKLSGDEEGDKGGPASPTDELHSMIDELDFDDDDDDDDDELDFDDDDDDDEESAAEISRRSFFDEIEESAKRKKSRNPFDDDDEDDDEEESAKKRKSRNPFDDDDDDEDERAEEAKIDEELAFKVLQLCVEKGEASISMVQRAFSVSYNRAADLVEWMEKKCYITPFTGTTRKTLISAEEFKKLERERRLRALRVRADGNDGDEETKAGDGERRSEGGPEAEEVNTDLFLEAVKRTISNGVPLVSEGEEISVRTDLCLPETTWQMRIYRDDGNVFISDEGFTLRQIKERKGYDENAFNKLMEEILPKYDVSVKEDALRVRIVHPSVAYFAFLSLYAAIRHLINV